MDNYNLRNGEITKWYEVSKYSQIYTLRNGNLYFTKWENILYEMRKFLIYILRNGNCMVTILKSILYEMKNNQVWKIKVIYVFVWQSIYVGTSKDGNKEYFISKKKVYTLGNGK